MCMFRGARRGRLLGVACVAASAVACGFLSASSDAPPTCRGADCGAAPGDWEGPFSLVVTERAEPEACSGGPAGGPLAVVLRADLEAEPAACSCTCGAPTVACPVVRVRAQTDPSCAAPCGPALELDGGCQSHAPCQGSISTTVAILSDAGAIATCDDGVVEASVPPTRFGRSARLCAAAAGRDGRCLARVGEHACPAGYAARTVFHAGVADDRGCGRCACAPPAGAACGLRFGTGCAAAPVVIDDGCIQKAPIDRAMQLVPMPPAGACVPMPGGAAGAIGAASLVDPVTVCCEG